jgi:signal transduction histidine kinase
MTAPLDPLDPAALEALAPSERAHVRREQLHRLQLRSTAAEVAAAIAHAAGTPLNVIGGRVELMRQDPAGAPAQLDRIEEQVYKLADGLRDLIDYLSPVSETRVVASAQSVLDELLTLSRPLATQHGVELRVTGVALANACVHADPLLANLSTLVAWATRCVAGLAVPSRTPLLLDARVDGDVATFELSVPGLHVVEGWRLERFEARPSTAESEPYRTLSICAAIARGHGGKLLTEAAPDGDALRVRLLYPLEEQTSEERPATAK